MLGPLLLTIYISDTFNVSKLLKLNLFADDTNIFVSNTTLFSEVNDKKRSYIMKKNVLFG